MIITQSPHQQFWTVDTFVSSDFPNWAVNAYNQVLPYVRDFLCAAHPHRDGKVCPFVPSALNHGRIFFTSCAGNDSMSDHAAKVQQCVEFYLSRKRQFKGFGALIILFPSDFDVGRLLDIHFANKESCIVHSLMLGALYRTNQAPSLHNVNYFPLRTPTPVLVIRDLVASDLLFLDPKHYDLSKRLVFLKAFIETFHDKKTPAAQNEVEQARALYGRYQNRKRFHTIAIICFLTTLAILLLACIGAVLLRHVALLSVVSCLGS